MASKRPALGRGLAELLGVRPEALEEEVRRGGVEFERPVRGEPSDVAADVASREDAAPAVGTEGALIEVPVGSITPNPRQPRRSMDREGLEELARSIESSGVVQPLIVRRLEGGFELIAGERRWRAAQMAGYTLVPAILRDVSDTESLEISLIENVVRQQLNPVDEALALHVLMEDLGATQEGLSERVGKSRPAIANKLRLLELPREVQELLAEGALSEGHGRALLGLKARGERLRLARRAVARSLSVRALEQEVRRLNEGTKPARASAGLPPDGLLEQTREAFYGRFEVVPRVKMTAKGGRIELPFKDEAELRRLLERLGG